MTKNSLNPELDSVIDIAFEQRLDFYSDLDPATPSDDYDSSMDGMLVFTRNVYNQQAVVKLITPKGSTDESSTEGFFSSLGDMFAEHGLLMVLFSLFILLPAIGLGYMIRSWENPEDEKSYLLEAELIDED
jgi:hypothetical protein